MESDSRAGMGGGGWCKAFTCEDVCEGCGWGWREAGGSYYHPESGAKCKWVSVYSESEVLKFVCLRGSLMPSSLRSTQQLEVMH